MKMRLLVTRPEPQASRSASFFRAQGYSAEVLPVLSVEVLMTPELLQKRLKSKPYDALVMTSQQVIAMVEPSPALMTIPLYVPGEASAQTAKAHGFRHVETGEGTAASLIPKLQRHQAVLYLRAEEVRVDLKASLPGLEECVVYRTVEHQDATSNMAQQWHKGDTVLFYSFRTASIFESLAKRCGLASRIASCDAWAFSAEVAEALHLPWREIKVAASPTEESMLAIAQG